MRRTDRTHRYFCGRPATALTSADIPDAGGMSILPGYALLHSYLTEKHADCCRHQKQVSHHDRPPFTQIKPDDVAFFGARHWRSADLPQHRVDAVIPNRQSNPVTRAAAGSPGLCSELSKAPRAMIARLCDNVWGLDEPADAPEKSANLRQEFGPLGQ
jgi:hypothetical protein